MKKPETYNELINHHNCLEIIRRYEVTRAEIDRIYDYMNKLDHFALVADSKQIAIFNASFLSRSSLQDVHLHNFLVLI